MLLDVFFKGDAFTSSSLTASINKLPYVPGKIGERGWFKKKPIMTTSVIVEEKMGTLTLVPAAARGSMPNMQPADLRKARSFLVPHLPLNGMIMADDVQNVRAFGKETELEAVSTLVNEKLEAMRQNIEVTLEYHRIGAIQGLTMDADGTTPLYNWFTEFGISEEVISFDFSNPDADLKQACANVERYIEDSLGATPYTKIVGVAGKDFMDNLVSHPSVAAAFNRWQDGALFRASSVRVPFTFCGIEFEEYRGQIGDVSFIPDGDCRFVPIGVPDLFLEHYAPAPFMETVNTMGKAVYAKQERMPFDVGVMLHVNSNPLIMTTRPGLLPVGRDNVSDESE